MQTFLELSKAVWFLKTCHLVWKAYEIWYWQLASLSTLTWGRRWLLYTEHLIILSAGFPQKHAKAIYNDICLTYRYLLDCPFCPIPSFYGWSKSKNAIFKHQHVSTFPFWSHVEYIIVLKQNHGRLSFIPFDNCSN